MSEPEPLTLEAFQEVSGVSRETLERLEAYAALLEKWTRRINLVGKTSLPDLWRRHMLDSTQLLSHLPPAPKEGSRVIVDLGSGAGFPGLVLALLGAGAVHLVEADGRKAAFLREAARVTATEVRIHNTRIEALDPFPADVVTARALAPLPRLISLAAPFLGPEGLCIFLKGAGAEAELAEARESWNFGVESHPSCTYPGGQILVLGVKGRATTKC